MDTSLSHHFLTQAYNNAWSNHRLLKACLQLPDEQFRQTGRTSFFPSIAETLNHILTVDWFYIDALEREARGAAPHPDFLSFFVPVNPYDRCDRLAVEQRAVDRRLIAYCEGLRDEALGRIVEIRRVGRVQRETRSRLLSHVFLHQVHHRGQVHAMLSGTPVAPPQLDEFFSENDRALRAQDFRELGWTEEAIWGDPPA